MKYKILYNPREAQCHDGEIVISENAYCEHCGTLEHGDPTIALDGTWWCTSCCEDMTEIPEEILKEIHEKSKTFKKEFYKKRLKELDNE